MIMCQICGEQVKRIRLHPHNQTPPGMTSEAEKQYSRQSQNRQTLPAVSPLPTSHRTKFDRVDAA